MSLPRKSATVKAVGTNAGARVPGLWGKDLHWVPKGLPPTPDVALGAAAAQ